jgi:multisubunit Na+/H+ antiporter MnhB subunit
LNRQKINRITGLLMLIGFGSALIIYLTAKPEPPDPFGNLLANKKYLHELRVMGGKANVVSAEFMNWFGGLWHGESLAGTVAFLTVGVTLVFRFFALHPASAPAAPAVDQAAPSQPAVQPPPRT